MAIIPAASRICPDCGEEQETKGRGELEQLEGDLENLPQWLPGPQLGIRKHILEVISRKLDIREDELADDLIPQVPRNSIAWKWGTELREQCVGKLAVFIHEQQTKETWDAFDERFTCFLKLITGALCAAAESLSDFQAIAELNGYKPGWAYYRFQQKNQHVRS